MRPINRASACLPREPVASASLSFVSESAARTGSGGPCERENAKPVPGNETLRSKRFRERVMNESRGVYREWKKRKGKEKKELPTGARTGPHNRLGKRLEAGSV